jgi:hypothetical protein
MLPVVGEKRDCTQIYAQIHDGEDGVSNDHVCLAGGMMCNDAPLPGHAMQDDTKGRLVECQLATL